MNYFRNIYLLKRVKILFPREQRSSFRNSTPTTVLLDLQFPRTQDTRRKNMPIDLLAKYVQALSYHPLSHSFVEEKSTNWCCSLWNAQMDLINNNLPQRFEDLSSCVPERQWISCIDCGMPWQAQSLLQLAWENWLWSIVIETFFLLWCWFAACVLMKLALLSRANSWGELADTRKWVLNLHHENIIF